jgi:predicted O-linked N-acetylglucosamine transferase (SPINDLY family)
MYLLARMFELHDKQRFEIHAFSYGGAGEDEMRARLIGAVDHFHDVTSLDDQAIANRARALGIDIAVDLKGYTEDGRPAIFAHRAAPVQLSYLGYPGTLGSDFIDYILADPVVIPPEQRAFYSEKLLLLPNSYQPNDDRRRISAQAATRSGCGLPEKGFVFCCFNNSYKITACEFDIWMRLLGQVEGSVLWLLRTNMAVETNLRREAARRGIDPARLVFADKMPLPEHLARHRCADLFLDTFNVNAHTTASDALWAGLPVLTKIGKSFAARVAASLLHAVGMQELVTDSADDYERLAFAIATDSEKLAALRHKLAQNRLTTPLFDAERYVRDVETVYERIAVRHETSRAA